MTLYIVGIPGPISVFARPFFNLKFVLGEISAEVFDSGFGASPSPAGTEIRPHKMIGRLRAI